MSVYVYLCVYAHKKHLCVCTYIYLSRAFPVVWLFDTFSGI